VSEDELKAIEVLYSGDIPQEWKQHRAQIVALIAEIRRLKIKADRWDDLPVMDGCT